MNMQRERYDEIERLMRQSLVQVEGKLSEQDRKDVAEYIEFGEYGAAYELLIFILFKAQSVLPESLEDAGKIMGIGS